MKTKAIRLSKVFRYGLLAAALASACRFDASATVLTTLHHFTAFDSESANADGAIVMALTQAADGKLYGVTAAGGAHATGTLFVLTPSGAFTTLHTFGMVTMRDIPGMGNIATNVDGGAPVSLILGKDGNFYGTAVYAGSNGTGTLFKLTTDGTPAGSQVTVLHTFSAGTLGGSPNYSDSFTNVEGGNPLTTLVETTRGRFFGTTEYGGDYGVGVVFRMDTDGTAAGTTVTPLLSFDEALGAAPQSGLIRGRDGNFYGTSTSGGWDYGTLYKVGTDGTGTILHWFGTFRFLSDPPIEELDSGGRYPFADLLQASDGKFYGTTTEGGDDDLGAIFQLTPRGEDSGVIPIYSFDGADGADCQSWLVQAADGSLYGTARRGGDGHAGTLFKVTTKGKFTRLHSFGALTGGTNREGALPQIGLLIGRDGDFYGATAEGGTHGNGTIFRFSLRDATFAERAGTYIALLDDGSGFVTIVVTATGSFTGKVVIGTRKQSITGAFNATGDFTKTFGQPPLAVSLHLDLDSAPADAGDYTLAGTVDGRPFTARHAAYVPGRPLPDVGTYTALLEPTGPSTAVPQGTGYATIKVSATGAAKVVGTLADGTAFSVSGPVVGGGDGSHRVAIYHTALHASRGLLAGTLKFEPTIASDSVATLRWVKPPQQTGAYYRAGFDTALSLQGARYRAPPSGELAVPLALAAGNARLEASGGSLPTPLSWTVTLTSQHKVIVPAPNDEKLRVTVNPSTGIVGGSFVHPVGQKLVTLRAILYQKGAASRVGGYFLGPVINQVGYSGALSLVPP